MEEIWLPIPNWEDLYEVSNLGRIKSLPRQKHTPHGTFFSSKEKILTPSKMSNHYLTVTVSLKPLNQAVLIHRIVATVFLDNPHGYSQVNHKNGIRWDNRVENLEWCTASYNVRHALDRKKSQKTKS
jgi:hypothetical protein